MAACSSCSKDVIPTTYGRCPLCGTVVSTDEARTRDAAAARNRDSVRAQPDGPEPSGCGNFCLVIVGFAALAVCMAMFSVGQRAHWTSDGPGMLFIMILFAGSGVVALTCIGSVLLSWIPGGRKVMDLLDD